MADKPDDAKARAEAKFRKQEERDREAAEVHAEIAAKARATDAKTTRLKAQRLARDAADKQANEPALSRPSGGHARGPKRKHPPKLIANPDEVPGG